MRTLEEHLIQAAIDEDENAVNEYIGIMSREERGTMIEACRWVADECRKKNSKTRELLCS